MTHSFYQPIDYFIPEEIRQDRSNLMKVRMFIVLHLLGPAMGQLVMLCLWRVSKAPTWEFWTIEACVASFWLAPILVKVTRSLLWPAALSVQTLMFVSLFGSFFYGGMSSPFMPWLLIALLLGFFYLAEQTMLVLAGVAAQLVLFVAARLIIGSFPVLLPPASLTYANLISILSALIYITLLSMYYEAMLRGSGETEQAAREHRAQAAALGDAMRQAETASQQKSIFLSKMSYELRTPLNAMIGYGEMLHDDMAEEPSSSHRAEDLKRLNAAGRHLLALVTRVFDVTSIEADRLEIATEKVEVAQLIREVAAIAEPLVAKRDNQLVVRMPDDLDVIDTDPLKLRQSLLNLLGNAAKFTSRGTITVSAMRKELGTSQRLIIQVRDTGIGMTEEAMGSIFREFSQAGPDIAQTFGGTGLGLALTRRFCTLMGGEIRADSHPGEGSSFTIDLPYRTTAKTEGARSRKSDIRAELGKAVSEGQLELHYQPIIDARTGQLKSVEALSRWNSPRLGSISPAVFIPIAEEGVEIIELSNWVIDQAIQTIKILGDVPVGVNVSPVYFRHNRFATMLADKLLAANVSPHLLYVEVTEGVLVSHMDMAKRTIGQLSRLGIKVYLDDFGTGYSSLSYLQNFEFDGMKIDKSFLRDIGQQPQVSHIIRAVVDLGHSLNLQVVAEGVENQTQARLLQLLNCDLFQGFHFAPPMSLDDLKAYIQNPPATAIAQTSVA